MATAANTTSTPSNYTHLLYRSLKLYSHHFSHVILLSLCLGVLVFLPRFIAIGFNYNILLTLDPFSWNRIAILVLQLAALTLFIAILWHLHCGMIGKRDNLNRDVKMGFHRLFLVFIGGIIQSLVLLDLVLILLGLQSLLTRYELLFNTTFGGMAFTTIVFFLGSLVILYCLTLFMFLTPLIVVENLNIIQAIKKSIFLVWNHFWRIISLQATPWILYLISIVLLRFIFNLNIHIYFLRDLGLTLSAAFIHMVIFALFIPWIAALLLVQLEDLELRET